MSTKINLATTVIVLSSICWITVLIINVISAFGIDVRFYIPYTTTFHLIIFPLAGILAYLYHIPTSNRKGQKELFNKDDINPIKTLRNNFPAVPPVLIYLAFFSMLYGIIGFFYFMINSGSGSPSIKDGQFVTLIRGNIKSVIDEGTYHHLRSMHLLGMSGIWIGIYSALVLVSVQLRSKLLNLPLRL